MSTTHTPGPWQCVTVHPTLSLVNDHITNAAGEWVAVMATNRTGQTVGGIPIPRNEVEANARLIAAAPELLAQLERAHLALVTFNSNRQIGTFPSPAECDEISAATLSARAILQTVRGI